MRCSILALILISYAIAYSAQASEAINALSIEEQHDKEIAASAELVIPKVFQLSDLKKCIPVESRPFDGSFSLTDQKKLFSGKELEDLMKCNLENCAFNFLPYEKRYLQTLDSKEKKSQALMNFLADRIKGRTPVDPSRSPQFIRQSEKTFPDCHSDQLDQLLQKRLNPTLDYRIQVSQYDKRMRPTVRLVQGEWFTTPKKLFCYAEALGFSTHYDDDRVEVWSFETKENQTIIHLSIRNRIDFLRTWFRRLQKPRLRDQLKDVITQDLNAAASCLNPLKPKK